jgi:hypothetical protein
MKAELRTTLIFTAILLLIGGLGYVLLIHHRPSPPLDDIDLRYVRPVRPATGNALAHLQTAADLYSWTGRAPLVSDMGGTNWTDAAIHAYLSQTTDALAEFNRALSCPFLQFEEIQNYHDLLIPISAWRNLAHAKLLQAHVLLQSGQVEQALVDSLDAARLGHLFLDAGGGLIHCLIGIAIMESALGHFRSGLPHWSGDPSSGRAYQRRLEEFSHVDSGFQNAWRVEYQPTLKFIDDVASGKYSGSSGSMDPLPPIFQWLPMSLMLNPHRTKTEYARSIRQAINNTPRPYAEMGWTTPGSPAVRSSYWRAALSGNLYGQLLNELLDPSSESALKKKCGINTSIRATRVLVALRGYSLEHGELPATLEELAPGYLPAVPLDDFDGRPLRYDPVRKIVYSVGEDLLDSGGSIHPDEKNPWKLPDPTFAIPF